GFVRLFGADAAGVGVSIAVTLVVAMALPSTSGSEALARGEFTLLGGAGAGLASLLLWPVHPLRPAREAVAQAIRQVAAFSSGLASMDAQAWARERIANVARVREGIERARTVLGAARRGRNGSTPRGQRL